MNIWVNRLLLFGTFLIFACNGPFLTMIGWPYDSASASFITKLHPGVYVFALAAGLGLVSGDLRYWQFAKRPVFLAFLAAAIATVLRAVQIAASGVTGGELSAAIVTFLLPAFIVIAYQGASAITIERASIGLRIFFVLTSLMGLAERLLGFRFIPSFLDFENRHELRASSLFGHPLNAAVMTAMMIVYLVTARRRKQAISMRLPEIILHTTAMFCFGGRSALVFTPIILLFSGIMVRQRRDQAKVTGLQRFLPLAILLVGVIFVMLPIPFVEQTLERFANDHNSAETRNAAVGMLGMISPHELLWGIDANRRQIMLDFFESPAGIELSWIALTLSYGAVIVIPLFLTTVAMFVTLAFRQDRSALYMALLFMIVTAGSLSLGSKSLLLACAFVMMLTLSAPYVLPSSGRGTRRRRREKEAEETAPQPAQRPDDDIDEDSIPEFLR